MHGSGTPPAVRTMFWLYVAVIALGLGLSIAVGLTG
jgi:hypothetical protein